MDGESLAARLDRDGRLPAVEAARIAADVADALYHAHRQGIIHRDVKPGNVLLGRDGSTRLVDFGIARSLAEAAERLTLDGGTPRYMAPEQLADAAIGPRTDLFGLGLLLHEMLTGRSPFKATAPLALAEEQAAGPPPLHGIASPLAALIRACLEPDPEKRPVHAGAVASGLRAWLVGDPAPAMAVAARQRVPPAPEPSVDSEAVTQQLVAVAPPVEPIPTPAPAEAAAARPHQPPISSQQPRGPRRAVALAAALAALALIGLLSVAFLDPSRQPTIAAPTNSPSAAAEAPTPSQVPEWLAKLVEDYRDACGPDDTDQVAADLAAMSEDDAKDHVEELIDACGEGRTGRGRGRD